MKVILTAAIRLVFALILLPIMAVLIAIIVPIFLGIFAIGLIVAFFMLCWQEANK